MLFTRYELLLPQRYNDGRLVEDAKFAETWTELMEQFGAYTLDLAPRKGFWTHEQEQFADDLVKVVLDLEDNAENEQFIRSYKQTLLIRFNQIDLWIIAFPVRII